MGDDAGYLLFLEGSWGRSLPDVAFERDLALRELRESRGPQSIEHIGGGVGRGCVVDERKATHVMSPAGYALAVAEEQAARRPKRAGNPHKLRQKRQRQARRASR